MRQRPRTPSPDLRPPYAGGADAPAEGFTRLDPQTGTGLRLPKGATLTLVDPCGEQVSDLFLFADDGVERGDEWFSGGRTTDYANSIYVGPGGRLWSNRSRVLATIVEDTVGVHDLTLTPCSQDTFDILYPDLGGAEHPSCFANLVGAFQAYGISPDRISTTLNVFMDVWTDLDGELHIDPPPTVPGDRFAVQAEVDLLVGITACSAEKSNNGRCTPIDYRVAAP